MSACVGIVNPVATIEGIRELMFALLNGRTDASDPRILGYAGRLLPPDHDWRGEESGPGKTP